MAELALRLCVEAFCDHIPGSLWLELQARPVDAVAHAGGIGAVIEHMAQMASAIVADHFGTHHAQGAIAVGIHRAHVRWGEKAGPAGAAVEFRFTVEERLSAGCAAVHALLVVVPIRPGEGALGAFLAEDMVLLRRQLFLPLIVALHEGIGVDGWFGFRLRAGRLLAARAAKGGERGGEEDVLCVHLGAQR